jgi:hypothetical protein
MKTSGGIVAIAVMLLSGGAYGTASLIAQTAHVDTTNEAPAGKPDVTANAGRWKLGNTCYWDPNDSGPNQCDPNAPPKPTGRYKESKGQCYWEKNDSGPNQCDPLVAPNGEPPPVTDATVPQVVYPDGFTSSQQFEELTPSSGMPVCRNFKTSGNAGYIYMHGATFDKHFDWAVDAWRGIDRWGLWRVAVWANGKKVDGKSNYFYPPHGSLKTDQAPPGAIMGIVADHVWWQWTISSYWDPEYRTWRYTGFWTPAYAYGHAVCTMPF